MEEIKALTIKTKTLKTHKISKTFFHKGVQDAFSKASCTLPSFQEDEIGQMPEEMVSEEAVNNDRGSQIQQSSNTTKTNKKNFTIWEYLPLEERSPEEIAASKIINLDGYYDTIRPSDNGVTTRKGKNFDKRFLIGIFGLCIFATVIIYFTAKAL